MKKIYSTPNIKVAELELQQLICESIDVSGEGSAKQDAGMDANKRESNDGLFDW